MSSTENTGEKQSGIDHLMTTMMIGFELTGVLGTGITQYFIIVAIQKIIAVRKSLRTRRTHYIVVTFSQDTMAPCLKVR